jgi:hypothetical protein
VDLDIRVAELLRRLVLVVSEVCAGLRSPLSRSGPRRGNVAQGRGEESMF